MSLKPADAKLLRAALGKRTPTEVRRILKLARTNTDKALLAAALPAPKKKKAQNQRAIRWCASWSRP